MNEESASSSRRKKEKKFSIFNVVEWRFSFLLQLIRDKRDEVEKNNILKEEKAKKKDSDKRQQCGTLNRIFAIESS